MSYHLTVSEEWFSIHPEDLWVYNKLQLSQVLGYTCGPAGLEVPNPGFYIVRPCFNILGMSRYSKIEEIKDDTEHLHPAEFWCEIFEGEHISVDYQNKQSKLVVRGTRDSKDKLYQWTKWEALERTIEFPEVLNDVGNKYEWINCEFIGGKLIEVHFRRNPDFRYNNTIVIPVWDDQQIPELEESSGYRYIEDKGYHRRGFIIDGKSRQHAS